MDRSQWNCIQEINEANLLLEADEASSSFLEAPVFELALKIIAANVARAENLIGKTIDQRYLVEAELGHGAMGKVYQARDLELHGRPVVIKVLLQTVLSDPYVVKKFKQEVEALARIDHPNVVGLLGAGQLDNGQRYTVMQRVTGLTLRSQITSEGMHLERVASILKQIGAGLDHVHENGILHRDLKPENIMLQVLSDSTELVKIVDFGIAKVRESDVASTTSQNVPVGTLAYMSPEQLRGEELTPASDIFSMAVIAYEMITGRRPFNATFGHLPELHYKGKCVKPVALRPGLSAEAQAIILRALSFNAKNRYQKASEFGNNLARALTEHARKTFNQQLLLRRRSATTGLVALTCVAVLLGAYQLFASNRSRNVNRVPTQSFNYWLLVQEMPDDQETLESGDQLQLNVACVKSGCFYVLIEERPEPNDARCGRRAD